MYFRAHPMLPKETAGASRQQGQQASLNRFIYDFLPNFEIKNWPLNLVPLRKSGYLWTMLYGLTNLITGAGKVSAVFTVAHIFRATSNFSQKNMTRQGASCSIGSEKVWCIVSLASTLPRPSAFSSMTMWAITPLTLRATTSSPT